MGRDPIPAYSASIQITDFLMQEYLAQWVAKVASAEKGYRSATDQMDRPSLLAPALPQAAADKSSGMHLAPTHALIRRAAPA